ncbi:MAG TPA: hypothetical protein VN841_28035 [Bryobacteraceae bacterium]|nr:hypothetical protein [Bryobacteraceae bacterium]
MRFGKYANLSTHGWTEKTATQVIAVGQNAHIGVWGAPEGADVRLKPADPSICVAHEEPFNKHYAQWHHFLITALRDGETTLTAIATTTGSNIVDGTLTVKVVGRTGVKLVFFPGERMAGTQIHGTIYVIGGHGENIRAAGGPPRNAPGDGGHTFEPTPAGNYVLGPRVHVTTSSWPSSVIPWGAALKINGDGEVEFEASPGKWHLATGPRGEVTQAQLAFDRRDHKNPTLAAEVKLVRDFFIDPVTKKLVATTYEQNDFGRWGWNLMKNGHKTPFWVHTTPEDEQTSKAGHACFLVNSHGCIHLDPAERKRLMDAGYLKEGVPFEVRPYSETGPP